MPAQYIGGGDFAVSELYISSFVRISFRTQFTTENIDPTRDKRSKYISDLVTGKEKNVVHFGKLDEANNFSPLTGFEAEVVPNDALARSYFSIQVHLSPLESHEQINNVAVGVSGASFKGKTLPNLSEKSTDSKKLPAQYVSTFDWKSFMYHFFEIVNVIFILTKIFVIFVRPFLPDYSRLRTIWIGGTLIYYELLCYTGLMPGHFGWTIDQAQQGMIKSTRNHFWVSTVFKVDTERPFMVYKFFENEFYPVLISEVPWGVIGIVVSVVATFVLELIFKGGKRIHPVVQAAREMKSAILIFSFVPFWIHSTHNFYNIGFSKSHSFWQILSAVAMVWIGAVYIKKIFKIGTSVDSINYLHGREVYQKGQINVEEGLDWVFDTYIDMNSRSLIRQLELLLYILIVLAYASGATWEFASPLGVFIFYALLFAGSIEKLMMYDTNTDERRFQKKLLLLSIIHLFLQFFINLLYFIFVVSQGKLNLSGVKILTWIWFFLIFADVALLLV